MTQSVRLGVVTGLEFEAQVIRRRAAHEGLADRILVASGLGRERARNAAETLLGNGVTALLSFGIAGGLDPTLASATAVIASAIKAEKMPTLACTPEWTARLQNALSTSTPLTCGELAYAPLILTTSLDKAGTFAATGAVGADMESYGVGEAALAANVPFAALRVIADTAGEQLPEIALHAIAEDGSLKVAETLGRVAKSPWQIPALLRLGRSTARARRRLDELAAIGAKALFFSESP